MPNIDLSLVTSFFSAFLDNVSEGDPVALTAFVLALHLLMFSVGIVPRIGWKQRYQSNTKKYDELVQKHGLDPSWTTYLGPFFIDCIAFLPRAILSFRWKDSSYKIALREMKAALEQDFSWEKTINEGAHGDLKRQDKAAEVEIKSLRVQLEEAKNDVRFLYEKLNGVLEHQRGQDTKIGNLESAHNAQVLTTSELREKVKQIDDRSVPF